MSIVVWQGNAPAVAQVSTFTVQDTWATGDTATLTCGSASVTFTVAGTETVSAVVAGLVALWNASAAPELAEITAADNDPDITLTMDAGNEGIPFTVTGSEVNAGDGTIDAAQTDTTANSGPNSWDVAPNWSGGAVPVNADDVILENSAVSILYGLAQSGVTLASLTRHETFTGTGGLPRTNSNDTSNPYVEYRPTYLEISATNADLGVGTGSGSGRFKLDTGANQTTITISSGGSAARAEVGIPRILWKGTHTDNAIYINRGDLGIAFFGPDSANFETMGVGFVDTQATDANVYIGSGVTHKAGGEITMNGGVFESRSAIIVIQVSAGVATVSGSATVTTLRHRGGTYYPNTTGTLANFFLHGDALFDCRQDMRTTTITSTNIYGGTIQDPMGTIPAATVWDCIFVRISDVYLGVEHQDWTRLAK